MDFGPIEVMGILVLIGSFSPPPLNELLFWAAEVTFLLNLFIEL